MKLFYRFCMAALFFLWQSSFAVGATRTWVLSSPDGSLKVTVSAGKEIKYSLQKNGQQLLEPSAIAMDIAERPAFGRNSNLRNSSIKEHRKTIPSPFYTKQEVENHYKELVLTFQEDFNLEFRAYNDGMAYRFVNRMSQPAILSVLKADFNFAKDWQAYVPYVRGQGTFEYQFKSSFSHTYAHLPLSHWDKRRLAFLPLLVEADDGIKMVITEADLDNYPGLFLHNDGPGHSLHAVHAPYPRTEEQGGHNQLEVLVTSYETFLAKLKPNCVLPWRIISISTDDRQLLADDMVYRLAQPCQLKDVSWIKPGKVAWEWWNDWGIYNVPFESGINTETYKAYIDFAAKHGIEYVILDEGWAVNLKADLFQVVPEIDLPELIRYGNEYGVGIILWAGCYAFMKDMERVCQHYSKMGVKGFKLDFINRDDAKMTHFHRDVAKICAKYKLLVDFHGTYKPTGMLRTWPNVLNNEGIMGQEVNKWTPMERYDQVQFDTEFPFIRMLAGPVDYTQGAMLNGTRNTFRVDYSEPMSQGTRCHQLGEYVIFFSPINMLCDSPTHYEQEAECTAFIAQIPTTWDETIPLESKVGEYIVIARRKGNTWFVGGLTNWTARDLTVDLSPLGIKDGTAEAFTDGPNADKFAQDYQKTTLNIKDGKLNLHLAQGGGFALKVIH